MTVMTMDELEKGIRRLAWAAAHMPVLSEIRERMKREEPLKGLKIGMALHVEAKTGVLAIVLTEAGARVRLASCNPLSTDDSVALALRKEYDIEVYAKKGDSEKEYYNNLNKVLDLGPDIVIDDGADLITIMHTKRTNLLKNIRGGCEETTTGVNRLKAMAAEGKLRFPVISVNDAKMKFLFDNRYGTGQSVFDGWMNSTNLLIAGKRMVVAGYGWCGKGIAMRAKGFGANVIVTEVDPVKAVEARLDGFEVMPMAEAVKIADAVITATGCKSVVTEKHIRSMKDGCILGNAGHFDNEIDKNALAAMSENRREAREFVEEYTMKDGRKINLLADGRLMNLAAGQGHPAEIMDSSFAAQALAVSYLVKNWEKLECKVYDLPEEMDIQIARAKLKAMGITIDELSDEQKKYMAGWEEGT
jgi:adenosylhomocysteinase